VLGELLWRERIVIWIHCMGLWLLYSCNVCCNVLHDGVI
jgi:hypothetical protein